MEGLLTWRSFGDSPGQRGDFGLSPNAKSLWLQRVEDESDLWIARFADDGDGTDEER